MSTNMTSLASNPVVKEIYINSGDLQSLLIILRSLEKDYDTLASQTVVDSNGNVIQSNLGILVKEYLFRINYLAYRYDAIRHVEFPKLKQHYDGLTNMSGELMYTNESLDDILAEMVDNYHSVLMSCKELISNICKKTRSCK